MGEFGRSPGNGAGHFCRAWSSVFAGGGLKTGQVIGKTSEGDKNPGNDVVERPVSAPDFMATLCLALGIDIHQEFLAPGLRPVPLVDKAAKPITELLG
jgi:arylsulfatase A-like enzyme